jgi:hypothetical protein
MPDTELTCVPNEAAPRRSTTGLDRVHLERALEVLRHVSSAVDNGRTWNAIHAALTAPPSAAVETRLARLERDLMRVMSIVANPAPRAILATD